MKATDFCYWLQGYFELSPLNAALTPAQVIIIRNHLNLVFKHDIDPTAYGVEPPSPSEAQDIHDGTGLNVNSQMPSSLHNLVIRC